MIGNGASTRSTHTSPDVSFLYALALLHLIEFAGRGKEHEVHFAVGTRAVLGEDDLLFMAASCKFYEMAEQIGEGDEGGGEV